VTSFLMLAAATAVIVWAFTSDDRWARIGGVPLALAIAAFGTRRLWIASQQAHSN